MSLIDKFRIIEDHIGLKETKYLEDKVENYFENLINLDFKLLSSDYINQIICNVVSLQKQNLFFIGFILIPKFPEKFHNKMSIFYNEKFYRHNLKIIFLVTRP